MKKKKLRVAIFFGGTSKEREVSLRTGLTVAAKLNSKKYEFFPVEISAEGKWLVDSPTIRTIGKIIPTKKTSSRSLVPIEKGSVGKIDVALLALHGPGGEDGTIQGMLELLKIPYTCSGVLASAVAMDKARTKRLVVSAGVPVLPDMILDKNEYQKSPQAVLKKIRVPVVIKPNRMGSSLGISIVKDKKSLLGALQDAFEYDSEVLIEPYAMGREMTVPVLGNREAKALPVIEILPWNKSTFYDYSAKYEQGGSDHIIPARVPDSVTKKLQTYAEAAHRVLGCRGVTRSDFILAPDGRIYFLELNTIPGMTPTSLVPQSAEAAGIGFSELLDKLIGLAFE